MEFSAVPYGTRIQYLNRLLKRKNSTGQKNITLLKMLYKYIDENIIYKWDPEEASKKLGITPAALYKQKSRLLAGLRAYYCRWNDAEHKTNARIKYAGSQLNSTEKDISIKIKLALEMNEAGLRKEAKDKFLEIEKELVEYNAETKFKYLNLTHIYERLMIYYYVKNDKGKISELFFRLKQAASSSEKFGLTEPERILLSIWINYAGYIKDHRDFFKRNDRAGIITYLNKVYREAKKINAHDYVLRSLHGLASTEIDLKNFAKAEKYAQKGYEISRRPGCEGPMHSFAAMLYVTRIQQGNKNVPMQLNELIQYYKKLKEAKPLEPWAVYMESFCGRICLFYDMSEASDFYLARANSNILTSGHTYAAYMLFEVNSGNFLNSLLTSFVLEKGWAYLAKIDNALLDSSENSCLTTLHYNKAINDMGFIWEVYLQLLVTLFLREDDFDYERALLTINKMDRLIKNKRKVSALSSYRLLKLAVKMIEHSDNPAYMLRRYEYKFKKTIDYFKENPTEIDIYDYAIMSSLARRLGTREITALVKGLYQWLQANHPVILAPVFRELEERKTQTYTAQGKEAAA